ncbi:Translation initiation factor 3 subunit b [Dimargaris cristalligena]|uniref:Eukaryotic translation initiation factor 3 subunit B n=1 Tax=Dimargaris cristalligena TaxID=215637 RepID=A0A4P9ZZR9_9FUNG|nr:Translation initiation factor 3 subunit b [Dimargaris cristalligena]RKP38631.1 eukaryotic translation initiation factor eIF2A-domain-containing protein [Dimargaris cristalligena]|eukprot:RKP38631.1 eukaryotic translation initiation factor eIF2A-domain-containing protein [Dimargaris cristalligena]
MPALDPRNLPASEADIDFSDIEEKYHLTFNESFDNVVVVDNLPVVDESKLDRLLSVVKKIFKPAGTIKEDGLFMPTSIDPNSGKTMTQGYLFMEFNTPEQASAAIKQLDGFKLDKTHILAVHKYTDVERYATMNDTYKEPVIPPYEEREHLKSWLLDPKCRDQFVALRGDEVAVMANNKNGKPDTVFTRSKWTESYLQWSPRGTYLTTYHRQGVVLWGGASWSKIMRFIHPNVKLSDFSPHEKFLVTFSPDAINHEAVGMANPSENPFGPEDDGNHLCVWDIRTGNLLRSFPMPQMANKDTAGPSIKDAWPHFKWSSDDRYFARVVPGQMLSIYEAPSMGLLDRKSIKVEGISDFAWSPVPGRPGRLGTKGDANKPTDYTLAYWTPEMNNQPARVTLINVPTKEVLRTKNLFNTTDCKLYWHPSGEYLCVKVDRLSKTKKSTSSNLEIFLLSDRALPVETIELKETVVSFAWEPKGKQPRFAVITTVDPSAVQFNASGMAVQSVRNTVSFYEPEPLSKLKRAATNMTHGNFKCKNTLEKKPTTALLWSPNGRYIILGSLRSTTVWDMEFWDMDYPLDNKKNGATEMRLLTSPEHYGVTDVEWDPTGRYVVSYASAWRHSMENGFIVWDCKGTLLGKFTYEKFKQFLWRPRPPTLLTEEDKKRIAKKIPELAPKFEEEDLMSESAASSAVIMKRRRAVEEWNAWRAKAEKEYLEECQMMGKTPMYRSTSANAGDESANVETIEEWVEEVIEETEEVVE